MAALVFGRLAVYVITELAPGCAIPGVNLCAARLITTAVVLACTYSKCVAIG